MTIRAHHWMAAGLLAACLHGALAVGLLYRHEERQGARQAGVGGLEISISMVSAAAGTDGATGISDDAGPRPAKPIEPANVSPVIPPIPDTSLPATLPEPLTDPQDAVPPEPVDMTSLAASLNPVLEARRVFAPGPPPPADPVLERLPDTNLTVPTPIPDVAQPQPMTEPSSTTPVEPDPVQTPVSVSTPVLRAVVVPSPPPELAAPVPVPRKKPVLPKPWPVTAPPSPPPVATVPSEPRTKPADSNRVVSHAPADPTATDPTEGAAAIQSRGRAAAGIQASRSDAATRAGGGRNVGTVKPDYVTKLRRWLERHKTYPRKAKRRRQQGVVLLAFSINRDGIVLDSRIEKGSGHDLLDRETTRMLERAQPLPRFPAEFTGNVIELIVPIRFSLSR